jgi:hypothetical protein
MALQKTLKLTNNFGTETTIENAYIKIGEILFSKRISLATVLFKKTKEDDVPLKVERYGFESIVGQNSKDAIAQGYDYLKTLPEFSDAVDC